MNYTLMDRFTEWSIENGFLGFAAMMLAAGVVIAIIAAPFVIWDALRPDLATLKKGEWECTASHIEHHWMLVGKVPVYRKIEVCDAYGRIR